jgi:hypothetical protein
MVKNEVKRYRNDTIKRGRVIYSNDIIIKKISDSELSLETSLHINTNSVNKIELVNKNKEKKKLAGEAISSLLRRTQIVNGDYVPIYAVGIKFIELSDEEKHFLNKLKSEHANEPASK